MSYEQIAMETHGAVAVLKLNRPDRLNAWTYKMMSELVDAIEKVNANPDLGAIVLTGEGRGFCAGADIQDTFKSQLDDSSKGENTARPISDWISTVRSSKPIVAAINGPAVGIGVTMVLPCDVIVASEEARFGLVFVKMGIVPELASSHFLTARMGFGKANEMLLTGRIYPAAEAHANGLTDHLVPADQLMSKALEIAGLMAENPSLQLRMTKELVTQNAAETDLQAVQQREGAALKVCYASAEHAEAVDAFLNKRKPDFKKIAAGKTPAE